MSDNGLPEGWAQVRLDEIADVNPRRPKIERVDTTLTTFVPMPAVDGRFGTIAEPLEREFSTVKKGYTYFEEGDVIFAKITPCMQNGKHAIARDLIDGIGFGSTEFHVIRPRERVKAEWLWLYLRQPRLLEAFTGQFVGSVGQQRLPEVRLRELSVPLPSAAEQERIAREAIDALAETDDARDVATRLGSRAQLLERAVSREAFERLADLEVRPLGEVASVIRGVSFEKHEASTASGPGRLPILRAGNIQRELILDADLIWVPQERVSLAQRLCVGDVAMAVSSGSATVVGKSAPLRGPWEGSVGAFCAIVRPTESIDADYLALWMASPAYLEWRDGQARGSNILNLRTSELLKVALPLPSIAQQRRFALETRAQVDAAHHFADAHLQSLRSIAKTRDELLTQAFEGGI